MYIFFSLLAVYVIFDLVRGYRKAKEKRSYLIKNLSGTATVIILLFLFGPFFMISPIKIGYSEIIGKNVILYYPNSRASRADEFLKAAEEAAKKNSEFYGQTDKTNVLIATSDLDMLRFGVYPKAGGGGLPWGIVVRESRASWNIMAHEMSHKNLSKASKIAAGTLRFPKWFDEGLASYLGKMDYYQGCPELRDQLNQGRYPKDITNWRGILGNLIWTKNTFGGYGSRLIYGQTYQMVKYLFDTYGEEKVYQIVINSPKIGFENTFLNEIGKTPADFHQEFMNFLKLKF